MENDCFRNQTVGLAYKKEGELLYTITYFSPTGNTKHVATLFQNQLGADRIFPLEHINAVDLPSADHLILLFVIHGFNAPKPVLSFAKQLDPNMFKKVSLIAVGCNTTWVNNLASKEVRTILNKKGYSIVLDEVIAMPLNIVTKFPDSTIHNLIKEAEDKVKILVSKLDDKSYYHQKISFKTQLIHAIGKIEPLASKLFGLELYANKKCNQCGLCVLECPAKNIQMKDTGKLKFGFNCMMCMRCIYNCPTKAIAPRISKFILIKDGYSIQDYLSDGEKK